MSGNNYMTRQLQIKVLALIEHFRLSISECEELNEIQSFTSSKQLGPIPSIEIR